MTREALALSSGAMTWGLQSAVPALGVWMGRDQGVAEGSSAVTAGEVERAGTESEPSSGGMEVSEGCRPQEPPERWEP